MAKEKEKKKEIEFNFVTFLVIIAILLVIVFLIARNTGNTEEKNRKCGTKYSHAK